MVNFTFCSRKVLMTGQMSKIDYLDINSFKARMKLTNTES